MYHCSNALHKHLRAGCEKAPAKTTRYNSGCGYNIGRNIYKNQAHYIQLLVTLIKCNESNESDSEFDEFIHLNEFIYLNEFTHLNEFIYNVFILFIY